ncbi:MAG: hypothetical protein ACR2PS_00735 [Pseudomonadales bacterium]
MITNFDDYCIHQTTLPIAHPGSTDRNFYDRYWFNGMDNSGGFIFEIGFGVYPNRFVMDGHFSVSIGDTQHSFHASRRAPVDRTETNIGPLRIEVIEPMRAIRLVLAPNDTGVEAELTFHACTAPTEEPMNRRAEGVHVIMENSRFTQFGFWQGYFSVNGERTEVARATTYGTRDKSWGVRPIGEPQGGAPGLLNAEPGVYWCWSPINFGDICTQFGSFEDHDGKATQISACLVPTYENGADIPNGVEQGHVEMKTMSHKVDWKSGTRRAQSAAFHYADEDGNHYDIELSPQRDFYMLGIGYQHPEWGHGTWQDDLKYAAESWQLADVDPADFKHMHVHQIVTAKMTGSQGEKEGIGTLETICIGRHEPSGFQDFFDLAP